MSSFHRGWDCLCLFRSFGGLERLEKDLEFVRLKSGKKRKIVDFLSHGEYCPGGAEHVNMYGVDITEYGSDTTHPNTAKLPVFGDKIAVQEHLKNVSQQSGLTYSLLVNGPLLDWGLNTGFLLDLSGPVVTLYDGGDRKFSATTLSGVGKAVVGIINNLSATENTVVFVSEATVSQKDLLDLSTKTPEIKSLPTSELEQEAFAELAKPKPNHLVFVLGFLRRAIFGQGFGSLFDSQKLSNDLFGLKPLSEEELRKLVQ